MEGLEQLWQPADAGERTANLTVNSSEEGGSLPDGPATSVVSEGRTGGHSSTWAALGDASDDHDDGDSLGAAYDDVIDAFEVVVSGAAGAVDVGFGDSFKLPALANGSSWQRPRVFGPPAPSSSARAGVAGSGAYTAAAEATNDTEPTAQWASAAAQLARWAPPLDAEDKGESSLDETAAEPVFHMRAERFFPADCAMRERGAAADLPLGDTPYTLEAWVMPDEDVGHGGIVGWGDWGTQGAVQAFRFAGADRLKNLWWGNALVAEAPASLADGQYHHVAATWDGRIRRIFVDFEEVAQQTVSGYSVERKDNFCVGRANVNEHFRGRIKELKIWRVARSAAELRWDSSDVLDQGPLLAQGQALQGLGPGARLELERKRRRCPAGFEPLAGHVYGFDQFEGGYLSSAESIEDCARRCAYTGGCGSFEFSPSKKRCFRHSQTKATHEEPRYDFVFCRRAPCPSFKTEEGCVGPSSGKASHSEELSMRPGSYCIWSGGFCQAPMACTDQDCFLPDGGLPGMKLPSRYTLWISKAGLQSTMLPGAGTSWLR